MRHYDTMNSQGAWVTILPTEKIEFEPHQWYPKPRFSTQDPEALAQLQLLLNKMAKEGEK